MPAATRRWLTVTVACASLFVLLTLLVATHVTDHIDSAIRQQVTPVGSWNQTNQRLSDVPDYISPSHMLVALAAIVLFLSWRRRSWLPAALATLVVLLAAVPVLAVKWILPRTDTGDHIGASQGSFPSGHMTLSTVTVGCVLLLVVPRTRWWQWLLAALAPLGMAACLLGGEIHWATDIVGGGLLGLTLVSLVAVVPGRAGKGVSAPAAGESVRTARRVRPGSSARP